MAVKRGEKSLGGEGLAMKGAYPTSGRKEWD